jgi:hypothetical protein
MVNDSISRMGSCCDIMILCGWLLFMLPICFKGLQGETCSPFVLLQ